MRFAFLYFYCILFSCFSLLGQENKKMAFSIIENGMENQWISAITQDSKGFTWVGTQDGLYRYDGYRFEMLRNSPDDPQSLAANWVRDIAIDIKNNYWVATNGGGITRFSPKDMAFINSPGYTKNEFLGKYVSNVLSAGADHIVTCSEEGFSVFNIHDNSHKDLGFGALDSPMAFNEGLLWLTEKKNQLFSYNIKTQAVSKHYTFSSPVHGMAYIPDLGLVVSLSNKLILFKENAIIKEIPVHETLNKLTHDSQGNYYLASTSAIVKFDPGPFRIEKIDIDLDVSKSRIETIFLDRQGSLWVGTDKGLYKEKKYSNAFLPNTKNFHARRILKLNGTLYLGGDDGLYGVKNNRFIQLIGGQSILSLVNTGDTIIAGADNGKVHKFRNDTLVKTIPISKERGKKLTIYGLALDSNHRLWVGSWEGLYVFDKNDQFLKFIPLNTDSAVGESKITNVYVDSEDVLWVTTSAYGIFKVNNISSMDLETVPSEIIRYTREVGNKKSLTNNIIMSYTEDYKGEMWFGSDIGVMKYEEKAGNFSRFEYQGRLFDQKIMTLGSDQNHNLWITTISDGIYVFNEKEKTMRHFTKNDGLISNAFLFGSGYYDSSEEMMYFGTDEGVQQIDLSQPFTENPEYLPIITDFDINTAEGDTIISSYQIPFLTRVALAHYQNDFSVSFSALDFSNPEKINYAYSLDDDTWQMTDLQTAYFTNVPYGNHTLKVQAVYDGVIRNEEISSFDIAISPPWYLTRFAKIIYFMLICAACMGIYFYLKWRWLMQMNLELSEQEAERFKKLNDFKSNLYTDIAHEFKTPLTLISGPIDSTLSQGNLSDFNRAHFKIVQRNAHRLTSLVDQLLELAKLEDGKLKMNIAKGDLCIFLKTLSQSYEYQSQLKDIGYTVNITDFEEVWYDEDIIEKIVTNLLSNAFKYTPRHGFCSFSAREINNQIHLNIRNTAVNAANLQLEKLFTRFYQYDEHSEGTGVGLSLVKELVRVYGGSIDVSLEHNDILHFQLALPTDRTAFANEVIKTPLGTAESEVGIFYPESYASDDLQKDLPLLLLVEDHHEIRSFIRLALENKYQILEADNGKTGIEIALSAVPDILISDIRMPGQNGIDLCNTIKNDERTSHIPIILLTAGVGEELELKGLTSGADDYVTKPFKIDILEKRIANLVATRRKLRSRYCQEFILKPKDIAITPSDELFLNKVQKILDKHLSDPEFNSETFSKLVCMSRMQLHRKLMVYTGLSTSAFIRSQRLKQAVTILNSSDLTISEVAYTVGFNTPRYFMKCFKETFKKTPSEYIQLIDY